MTQPPAEKTVAARVAALPPLREAIAAAGMSARKSLGQNFLLDLNLTRRIARSAGDLTAGTTIEVGPGPGGLTRGLLLEGATHVVAIERDARAAEVLGPLIEASDGALTLIEDDALKVDLAALGPEPRRIVANLPYNVGTRLLLIWLRTPQAFESLTLMFQREVADRLTAAPGSEAYGRLTVLVTWLCEARKVMDVPPTAFTPAPKIWSSVVRLVPRTEPLAPADRTALETITEAAFSQRRKMLRQSLKRLGGDALIKAADLDPTLRPERLTVPEFCRLANAYSALNATDGPIP
ncbi:16S rRNA (adenine(1518)-N(6)/adenine(1519)-N(6))-dimethyltransferase RsmA [Thalassobaculum sp. OXR-137]|uniref:16S rRNA (adenine(1518)-N(6)/adenine(1519)-N(6))- dimethyltransferase RsmA n=1 Tax=Thalassobaculum sp. OXR-137 TaxID=3100173 RepID=UPI002AC8A67B|nr:16S rRNA (adenine(1518)-N(6)/adenine(1519)-N(6))-dimethyltransferase RsmA [Thalassobaculum sp. OXR-137]WPZ33460.1 16S rRNA (adenine(1518)-N(6)/adenine(1519)-N(6))-dimethyltransferase RsmA [Thalassobaculum sp. OXR-137]